MGLRRSELSIVFAGENSIRALNRIHRAIDSATDVLSFPLYDSPAQFPCSGRFPIGDIVINPSLAQRRAREQGGSFYGEIRRLMVHGLLHLAGYDHEKNPYQKRKMRRKEAEILEGLD